MSMKPSAAKCSLPACLSLIPWLLVFVVLFWPTFLWMSERFDASDSFYSHGWLVPLASGWLIWKRRDQLRSTCWKPSAFGFIALLPALLIHVEAVRLQIHVVSGFAMLAVLGGLVWTLWGWPAVVALRFPLLFLLFMVPLPGILLIATSFKMKMAAAGMATQALNFIHIRAAQAGSTINVPGVSVIVDDACSGLRSMISLLALSIFWTALLPKVAKPVHKAVIVAAAAPIALLANMVRIIFLVIITVVYGARAAEGFLHFWSGMVVFIVALSLLAWLGRALVPAAESAGAA